MRNILSKIVILITSFCISSCINSSNYKDSSTLSKVTILKTDETFLKQNNIRDFITTNSFPILKSSLDDDRQL